MHGSDRVPDLKRLRASLGWTRQTIRESEMALFSECSLECASKCLTPPTLSERRFIANHSRPASKALWLYLYLVLLFVPRFPLVCCIHQSRISGIAKIIR